MDIFSDLKYSLITPSRKRKYIFLGIGIFIFIIVLIIIIAVSSSSSKSKTKPESESEPQPDPELESDKEMTPFESYINTKKFLYVWKYPNAENFIKFVVDHKYSKVFIYVGCLEWNIDSFLNEKLHNAGDMDAKELIKKLKEKNIDVELCIYLNDKPDDFSNIEKMPDIANSLSKLQQELKFTALHFDIEPNDPKNYEALLHMYEDCRKKIKVSAILKPKWLSVDMASLEQYFTSSDYFKQFKDCETFAEAVVKVTDYSDVMAYSSNYNTINKFLDKYETILKKYKSHIGKPVLELEKVIADYSTYQRYLENNHTFFNYFVNVSKRFDGATIHHYTTWHEDLYCKNPKDKLEYYFGEPKKC